MTEAEVRGFCQNNGVNVSPMGSPLRVLDPTELPASVREFVNEDGTYNGSGTKERDDADHEDSKGAKDADESAVTKLPGDSLDDVEAKEAAAKGVDLADLTVPELKDQARDLEISGFSSMTKDELVKAIKKANK